MAPRLHELFHYLRDHKGSDLHLAAGLEPRIRLHGSLEPVEGWSVLSHEQLCDLLHEIATEPDWEDYEKSGDLDFAYGMEGVARFRANFLRQENGAGAVFRIIPEDIVPLDKLNLPKAIEGLAHLQQGLVLVTGPTGSGKSTTLAGIIDRINNTYNKHIVTIEDPVEFVHKNKKSVFSQREVETDTESFGAALRAAIRQDADVILVGEMRDLETISLAVTAAEMGALVFGTLHTNGAANTIDRLIDAFPAEEQAQIRTTLAESVAGIVSQLLLRTADGHGRCAVNEILLKTPGLPNVIREGNTPMIQTIIQGGRNAGMQLMDDALMQLIDAGRITPREAFMKATNKARFEELLDDEE
ncbi:MAG TPA: PilT/PilU family type 4a pilus ATPase [Thermoanaerobaculia bacterium]|jgi:twitching motility protein PilT|nr:PilT/PilU family type 4a pilus ATPase [Thermoanaerobaculia bacterium]